MEQSSSSKWSILVGRMACENPVQSVGFPPRRCMTCKGCLRYRSWLWTSRARLEGLAFRHRLFFTLTFRGNQWVKNEALAYGEVKKWLVKLRRKQGRLLRYVAFSEHGSRKGRLHFHVLVFSEEKWKRDEYRAAKVLFGHGFVHVKIGNDALAAYAAKYATKTRGRVRASQGFGTKYFVDRVHVPGLAAARENPLVKAVVAEFGPSKISIRYNKVSLRIVRPLVEQHEREEREKHIRSLPPAEA